MKVLHERVGQLFWIFDGYTAKERTKFKELRQWLKDNDVPHQYFVCMGQWHRLMILDIDQAIQFKLIWCTGELDG